jgi:hypothetical protein
MLPRCRLLHELCNMALRGNNLVREGLRVLERRLPPGWCVAPAVLCRDGDPVDGLAELTAPHGRHGLLALEVCLHLDPRGVRTLVESGRIARAPGVVVVMARYLGPSARAALHEAKVSYLDLTGNLWVVVPEPGLFIQTEGANTDPFRERRSARSLRGTKAGRIVRALVDHQPSPFVRELASLTRVDAGYVSRVLAFLDEEALVTRGRRGRLQSVDCAALLRRFARDAPLAARGHVSAFHAPDGLSTFLSRLGPSTQNYVLSGGLAAALMMSKPQPQPAILWVRDADKAATQLGLRPPQADAHVLVVEPDDDVVFDGATEHEQVRLAAPSQIAVDLLSFPGRSPADGEALMAWMEASPSLWRL